MAIYSVRVCLYFTILVRVTFVTLTARGVRYSSGKYIPGIRYGLRIENKDREDPHDAS